MFDLTVTVFQNFFLLVIVSLLLLLVFFYNHIIKLIKFIKPIWINDPDLNFFLFFKTIIITWACFLHEIFLT